MSDTVVCNVLAPIQNNYRLSGLNLCPSKEEIIIIFDAHISRFSPLRIVTKLILSSSITEKMCNCFLIVQFPVSDYEKALVILYVNRKDSRFPEELADTSTPLCRKPNPSPEFSLDSKTVRKMTRSGPLNPLYYFYFTSPRSKMKVQCCG